MLITPNNLIEKNGLILSINSSEVVNHSNLKNREFSPMLGGEYYFIEIDPLKELLSTLNSEIQKDKLFEKLEIELFYETCVSKKGIETERKFIYMSAKDYEKWPFKETYTKSMIKKGGILKNNALPPAPPNPVKEKGRVFPRDRKFSPMLNGVYFVHELDASKNVTHLASGIVAKEDIKTLGIRLFYETCVDGSGMERKFLYMSDEDYKKWPYYQKKPVQIQSTIGKGTILLNNSLLPATVYDVLPANRRHTLEKRKFSPMLDGTYFFHELHRSKDPMNLAYSMTFNDDVAKLGIKILFETYAGRKFIYMTAQDYEKWTNCPATNAMPVEIEQRSSSEEAVTQEMEITQNNKRKYDEDASSGTTTTTTTTSTSANLNEGLLTLDDKTLELWSTVIGGLELPSSTFETAFDRPAEASVQEFNILAPMLSVAEPLEFLGSTGLDRHYKPGSSVLWQGGGENPESIRRVASQADNHASVAQDDTPNKVRKIN